MVKNVVLFTNNMASKVFQNIDLVRAIYGFGAEHRERWTEVVNHFLETNIHEIVSEFCDSDYHDRKESAFLLFVKECYTPEERLGMLTRLRLCHCCSRHSHYKDVPYKPENPVPESNSLPCYCHCRHMYRKLSRSWPAGPPGLRS